MARKLYEHLNALKGGKDIEILLLMDNKQRTIGEKREALKNIAQGKYFLFCDDDDWLVSVDEIYEAASNDVDVITFKSQCRNADGSTYIVTMGVDNPIEHNNNGKGQHLDMKRPPGTQCVWNAKYKQFPFPASNYGEDAEWLNLLMPYRNIHIPKVLHHYNFSPEVSEATPSRCIVNLATQEYSKGRSRLRASLPGIDKLMFTSEAEIGAPLHSENPYAFKLKAIAHANATYRQVLWLDASVFAVGDITPVFDHITEHGYFMEEAGHMVGDWCPDHVLEYFKITREQAMQMPMFAAGYCGFDGQNPVAIEFFRKWTEAMMAGMFKGSWSETRHDMTCGSIIANLMGLKFVPGGTYFAYIGPDYGTPKPTVCFHVQGIN